MDIDPSTLFLINGKWGEIKQKFDDNQNVEDIDDDIKKNWMFLQIPKETDFEDEERIMEVSFSRLKFDGKGEK